jgi:hypothetical protein
VSGRSTYKSCRRSVTLAMGMSAHMPRLRATSWHCSSPQRYLFWPQLRIKEPLCSLLCGLRQLRRSPGYRPAIAWRLYICITHVAACVYARVCLHMRVHVQVLLLIRLDDAEENKGDEDGVRGEREAGSQAYMIGSKFLITSDYDLTGFGWMRCISFVTNVCALGNGVLSCSLTCVSRLLYVCVLRFCLNTRGCVY